MKKNELIPLKQVAGALGVSRSTLWRATKAVDSGFPPPLVCQRRVYWRQGDLPALRAALDRYQGRIVFEIEQRHARLRAALAAATGQDRKKRPVKRKALDQGQADLFGWSIGAGDRCTLSVSKESD